MVEQPTHMTVSGPEMVQVSRLWDHGLDYIQDASPQERYDRLEDAWRKGRMNAIVKTQRNDGEWKAR